ncbi:MAG: type IV pilus modification protein PilV [Dokdonella sp.]|uniref:type IV pilus modification protein PilV n=1 Tax=Dokdonella sp. TaxID=2291710 RepID=UPI0032643FE3
MTPSTHAHVFVIRTASTSRGFSLLEVLIAILIFSFGMLGLAALQSFSVKSNQSANFRTQATSLAYMIIDRMRANPEAVLQGQYLARYTLPADCNTAPPASPPAAAHDIAVWRQEMCRQLPDGQGDISFPGGTVVVAIKWTDSRWALNAADRSKEFFLTTTL